MVDSRTDQGFILCDTLSTHYNNHHGVDETRSTMRLNPLTRVIPLPQHYDSENSLTDSFHDESSNISDNSITSLASVNSFSSANDENSMNLVNTTPRCKKKETGHVKRPMNAFMLWSQSQRRAMSEQHPKMRNSEISTQLGKRWKMMTDAERKPFQDQSAELRAQHALRYPDYKYTPKKKVLKRSKNSDRNVKADMQIDHNNNNNNNNSNNNNNAFVPHTSVYYIQDNILHPHYQYSVPQQCTPMDGIVRHSPNSWTPIPPSRLDPSSTTRMISKKVGEIGSLRACDGNLAVRPTKNSMCERSASKGEASVKQEEEPVTMWTTLTGKAITSLFLRALDIVDWSSFIWLRYCSSVPAVFYLFVDSVYHKYLIIFRYQTEYYYECEHKNGG